jgi:hypothetical protein
MDWWLFVVIVFVSGVLLASIPLILWSNIGWAAKLIAVLGLFVSIVYGIDLCFFSYYRLTERGLIIGSQLREYIVPYRAMIKIEPGNLWSLISLGSQKLFALSCNNLRITLSRGIWRRISVSPQEREKFVNTLLHRIEDERQTRASRVRHHA